MSNPVADDRKAGRRPNRKRVRALSNKSNPSLREVGRVQVRQILRSVLAVSTYAVKGVRTNFIFNAMFGAGALSPGF